MLITTDKYIGAGTFFSGLIDTGVGFLGSILFHLLKLFQCFSVSVPKG